MAAPSKALRERLEGASNGSGEPIYAVIGGVPVVTIPLAVYAELLAASKAGGGARPAKPPIMEKLSEALDKVRRPRCGRRPLPSTIERDPEVAAFLRERFRLADTIERAHAACREHFGNERTPSKGRIERFRTKVRGGA